VGEGRYADQPRQGRKNLRNEAAIPTLPPRWGLSPCGSKARADARAYLLPRLRRSFRIAMAPRISRIECGNFMVNTLA
jgi:hypothetical protein